MGGGLKKEYSAGPMLGYDADASNPWPDFFDLNYTLNKQAGLEDLSYTLSNSFKFGASHDFGGPFDKPKLSRFSSEPLQVPGPSALRQIPSMPIATSHVVELSAKQRSPFDFDDFLATLKTDESEEVPQPSGSRFKQFFDSGSSPPRKSKLCPQNTDPRIFNDPISPFSPLQPCTISGQQNQQQFNAPAPDPSRLPPQPRYQSARRPRRVGNNPRSQQPLCRSYSSPNALEAHIEGSVPTVCPANGTFDCYDVDDITETDMVAAASRFNTIKEASLVSSRNETVTVRPLPAEECPVSPPPIERERPRVFKNQPQSSNSARWSPPAAVATAPPPSTMTTAALLQARLLAQQRSASGMFPGGPVAAQLVRPPMPVYQAGIQAGLPLQSAALLSQFVWLNVL